MGGTKPTFLAFVILFLFAELALSTVSKNSAPQVLFKANGVTIPFVENKGQLEDPSTLFYSNTIVGIGDVPSIITL